MRIAPSDRLVACYEAKSVNRKLNFREFRVVQCFVCELSLILKVNQIIAQLGLSRNNLGVRVFPSL